MTLTLDFHLLPRPLYRGRPYLEADAKFSPDGRYRHWLTRRWSDGPSLMFLQLNPSRADAHHDDATTRRNVRFADDYGYGALILHNLYDLISTDPQGLKAVDDPVSEGNDARIAAAAAEHNVIVFAWGANADPVRAREVASRVWRVCTRTGGAVAVFGWTLADQPLHPLRLAADTQLHTLTAGAHADFSDVDRRWTGLLADTREPGQYTDEQAPR